MGKTHPREHVERCGANPTRPSFSFPGTTAMLAKLPAFLSCLCSRRRYGDEKLFFCGHGVFSFRHVHSISPEESFHPGTSTNAGLPSTSTNAGLPSCDAVPFFYR